MILHQKRGIHRPQPRYYWPLQWPQLHVAAAKHLHLNQDPWNANIDGVNNRTSHEDLGGHQHAGSQEPERPNVSGDLNY